MNFIIILVILISLIVLCHNNVNGGDTLQVKKPLLKENNLVDTGNVKELKIKEIESIAKRIIDAKNKLSLKIWL